MMRSLTPLSVLFLIVFAPASFAATTISADVQNERKEFEMQGVDLAFAAAEKDRSEITLDAKLTELAKAVAERDPSISAADALHEIIEIVDGEQWTDTGWHRFGIIASLLRSQGLAVDENGKFWYSAQFSLLRTNSIYGAAANLHIEPIPENLRKLGDNHIGDIDVAGGKLYAGFEDGPKYNNPYIGVFDAHTLKFEKAFRLPHEQQIDGVPWAAVDVSKNQMYSSVFYTPKQINVYDMTTGQALTPIQMNKVVPHAQGAKVLNGMMYFTSDGSSPDPKGIVKVNMATGTVMLVAKFGDEMHELEGLAFSHDKNGIALYALGVGYGKQSHKLLNERSELHTFRIKQMSMRDQFRQRLGIY